MAPGKSTRAAPIGQTGQFAILARRPCLILSTLLLMMPGSATAANQKAAVLEVKVK
jgi:hypothetical protein